MSRTSSGELGRGNGRIFDTLAGGVQCPRQLALNPVRGRLRVASSLGHVLEVAGYRLCQRQHAGVIVAQLVLADEPRPLGRR